jgi:hypothetical protein
MDEAPLEVELMLAPELSLVPQLPLGQFCEVALVVPLLPTVEDAPLVVPALADVLPEILPAVFSPVGEVVVALDVEVPDDPPTVLEL